MLYFPVDPPAKMREAIARQRGDVPPPVEPQRRRPRLLLLGRLLLAAWVAWTGGALLVALVTDSPAGAMGGWIDVGVCAALMLIGIGVADRFGVFDHA